MTKRRVALSAATLLAVTVFVIAVGASGWWLFASGPPVVKEPANAAPVLTGVIFSWRGLLMQPARAIGRNSNDGLRVEEIEPDSPAAMAKLKPGDVITVLDGIAVNDARSLALAIADHCCGPTVSVTLWRNHRLCNFELPPLASPATTVAARTLEQDRPSRPVT
jgi:membrane-associated protease RseP (regulator of RpoE activity)